MSGQRTISCITAMLASAIVGHAADGFNKSGAEYPVAGTGAGDQVHPAAAFDGSAGYIVWQDNATDGNGLGISARRLGKRFVGEFASFRVNQEGAGDQENPRISLLPAGGAAVVWQGGTLGRQRIFARIIGRTGTFATGDLQISPASHANCDHPSIATLQDGSLVIAWSAFGPDGDMSGVFFQRISAKGEKSGEAQQVNETTSYNQRDATIVPLSDGSFSVLWISESVTELRGETYADLYARRVNADGTVAGGEVRLNSGKAFNAQAAVVPTSSGGFVAAWPRYDRALGANGWDIVSRSFDANGSPLGVLNTVNTFTANNQYSPSIAATKDGFITIWTSENQDGSKEGIFGRALDANGKPSGDEFAVNTMTDGSQIHGVVVSDGSKETLAAWSSYGSIQSGMDLVAQRLAAVAPALPTPVAPYVSALSANRLSASWPSLDGLPVSQYIITFDGTTTIVSSNNYCQSPLFLPGSAHTVTYRVRLADGTESSDSPATAGRTWGEDENGDGLPDDWQAVNWGNDSSVWPSGDIDSDGDGVSNAREFLAGTNPTDPASALRSRIEATSQGVRLQWNTNPGLIYQVETSKDLRTWQRQGLPRFAADTTDSIPVPDDARLSYFRIVRIR